MKKLLFLLLPLIGFAYSDCCEMISTNYHFKDVEHSNTPSAISHFDFYSEGDGFVNFSAKKAQNYSHYPVMNSGYSVTVQKDSPEDIVE